MDCRLVQRVEQTWRNARMDKRGDLSEPEHNKNRPETEAGATREDTGTLPADVGLEPAKPKLVWN